MKRAALAALVALAGCNGILGIESASVSPSTGEAGALDAGGGGATGPAREGGADTSTPCLDTTADPHNCGRCGHDCAGGACAAGVCQPYAVLTEPTASFGSLAMDAENAYFTETKTSTLQRIPIGGGGTPTTLFTGNTTLGLAPDLVVRDGFIYFIEDLDATPDSGAVVRCPVAGCPAAGPEKIVDPLTLPCAFAIDASGAVAVGTSGSSGSVLRCARPPCHAAFDSLVTNAQYITQVGINGSVVAWTELGTPGQGESKMNVRTSITSHTVETGAGILDFTMTADHLYYGGPSAAVKAATFDGAPAKIGAATAMTNFANDGSFVYWTDATVGVVWKVSVTDGAQPTKVSSNQSGPSYVAVDAASVAWIDDPQGGGQPSAIVRVVK